MGLALLLKSIATSSSSGFVNVTNTSPADTPMLSVELDVTTDPTNPARTWTNINQWVRTVQIKSSGRNHELSRTDAGSCTVTLDNRDGRFDPGNTTGPYYGGLKRMRWLRVRAFWNSMIYPRCQMLVEAYDQTWPGAGKDAICVITCTDVFKALSLYDLQGSTLPAEQTGARISRVLTAADVDYATIDTGQSTLVDSGELSEGSMALEHLRGVEETENGQVFANREGKIAFHDRHHRLTDIATVATVGENAGEIPYREARLTDDDQNIWNSIRVTASGADPDDAQLAEDTASIDSYYERRMTRNLLSSDTNEALAAAQYLLHLYAEPSQRLPQIQLLGRAATSTWPSILSLENSDRILWRRRPSTEGAPRTIEETVIVEQTNETIQPGAGWDITIDVSPADKTVFWQLGIAGRGELDQVTRLAY